jgi:hypothetical protein
MGLVFKDLQLPQKKKKLNNIAEEINSTASHSERKEGIDDGQHGRQQHRINVIIHAAGISAGWINGANKTAPRHSSGLESLSLSDLRHSSPRRMHMAPG